MWATQERVEQTLHLMERIASVRPQRRLGITARAAVARAGVSYRQLDHWLTTIPGVAEELATSSSPGSGRHRMVPEQRMPRLHVAADLIAFGLPPSRVWRKWSHQERLRKRAVMAPFNRDIVARQTDRRMRAAGRFVAFRE